MKTREGIEIFYSDNLEAFVTIPDREYCTCHDMEVGACPTENAENAEETYRLMGVMAKV